MRVVANSSRRTDGLKHIARKVHALAQVFAREVGKAGCGLISADSFFDTVSFDVSPMSPKDLVAKLEEQKLNLRVLSSTHVSASFDETHREEDVMALVSALKAAGVGSSTPSAAAGIAVTGVVPETFARTAPFLQQKIFNSIHSETEMMRYIHSLQLKDLGLDKSMISLGSCTMKLNSVSSLTPCSWPEVLRCPEHSRRL